MRKKFLLTMLTLLFVAMGSSGKLFADETNPVAKVGNTEYATIDEAIANWTGGTTLTLLADVTLSNVVTLKSTEHHILDLGTYTMTAASGMHAIEVTCNGRSSASYAITVNADADNPGGITANGKSCIYYKKSGTEKDRPIILINNGVFTGYYSLNITSNGNTNCPQIWINGGVFNSYMNLTKCMLKVSGGVFHAEINCTGDSSAYREIKGGRFKSWQFMTADADTKFWVGSGNGNYNVGVYVDDEGYLVVGGPVITEAGTRFKASSTYSGWSSYLKYSSANANRLYYTSEEIAKEKNKKMFGSGYNNDLKFHDPITLPSDLSNNEIAKELVSNTAIDNYSIELPNGVNNFYINIKEIDGENKIVFDVTPKNGQDEVHETSSPITFRLPVPAAWEGLTKVYHDGDLLDGSYPIQNGNYIEVTSEEFSEFAVELVEPLADYVVLPNGIDASNYEEKFGTNTVTDGTNYYATLQAATEAVAGTANAVLYCKPGADVGSLQHAPVTSTLTVYGNNANVTGGAERDFDLGNTDPNGGRDITADMTLTVKYLNGCGAWGAKATAHTVNLVFENCDNMGKVFISGTTGTLNITMTDCAFKGVLPEAIYSNADGAISLNNVAFSNLNKAVNLNHKAAGTQTVTINGCSFTNCGNNVAADEIPVRVLTSVAGGNTVLAVSNTTFSGTVAGGADILLPSGVGLTDANITSTAANVKPQNAEMVSVTADTEYTYNNAVAKISDKKYTSLQAAVNAVQNGQTITLVSDVTEDVTLTEKVGLYYTIDGDGKTMTGTITVSALSDTNDNRRITIKNINFVDTENGRDFITSTATNHYPRLTVESCSFTGTGKANANTVAIRLKSAHSVIIIDCTGTDLHSFLQNTSGWNLTVENVTVTDSKSGLALGTVQGVTVKGCTITADGYGIRMDAQYNNNAVIESNTINAFIPVVVRKAEVDSNIEFKGTNAMRATNTDDIWCAIGTSEYETNGQMPTAATGKVRVALNDTGLSMDGVYGAYVPVAKIDDVEYTTLEAAFKAATSGCEIKILENVTVNYAWDARNTGAKFSVPVTINGNGNTIKFTAEIKDNNWNTVFRFEENATVNNLTVDISEAIGAQRVITAKKSLNVDGLKIVGSAKYGIIFGEGASATDLAATEIVVKNSTLNGTRRAISDNEGGKDVKSVEITGNTLNANVYASASVSIAFNSNIVDGEVDLRSYAADNVLSVLAKDNTLKEGVKNYIYAKTIDAQEEFETKNPPLKVSTKDELDAALAAAKDGDIIVMTADIDYGTSYTTINKAITLDLGGKVLTTSMSHGSIRLNGGCTLKNGTLNHNGGVAALKVWDAAAIEDLVINVAYRQGSTIGGIVIQENAKGVKSIKNVTIQGEGLTNGIETYNCGNTTENVIDAMENVAINAQGTGMLISAPCGTATNCSISGGTNGIEIWIKGNYSASLDLVGSTVEGGVFAHDEFNDNPGVVNNGTLSLTADGNTTGAGLEDVTLTIARAENLEGVIEDVMEAAQAKIDNTYYITIAKAIEAAQAGKTVTILAGTYPVPAVKAGITIEGEMVEGEVAVFLEGTLSGTLENLTMKNIHIKGGNAQRWAYAKGNLVFENVTFEATSVYALHFDGITAGANLTYKNCTIIGWAALGGSPASCTFEGCTIKGNGTYGVIRTYFNTIIKDCTFDVANVNTTDNYQDGIHAVSGAIVTVDNCTNVNGEMEDVINVSGTSVVVLDGVEIKNVAKIGDKYYLTLQGAFAAVGNGAGKTVELLDNVDLAGQEWTPIGTSENPFNGNFDGQNHTIKNLEIVVSEAKEGKAYIGLFGYAKDVNIKNVVFENVNLNIACLDIDHSQGHIGAVAGSLEGTSTIENVTVKGDITVYATQTANGASRVAVVAGGNTYGDVTMKNVHVIANEGSSLIANNNAGALAGQLQGKMYFENCSSNIDVTVNKFFAGGLIGIAAGDSYFKNCHTTGNVAVVAGREGRANDHYRVGGIAGGWADGKNKVCTLVNCSYEGAVSGKNADGSVAGTLDYDGYVGRGYTLTNCAGSKVVIDDVEHVQVYNDVYGFYKVGDVYEIGTLASLKAFRDKVNAVDNYAGKTVVLTTDIDLNNEDWAPIGTSSKPFMGTFDGKNHTISNLYINDSKDYVSGGNNDNYVGLFGYMMGGNTSGIKNLNIHNVNITGCLYVGSVLGRSYTGGIIENCHVSGNISIDSYAYTGGIVGRHEYSRGANENGETMSIYNCSVKGEINTRSANTINADYAVSYVGGIVGFVAEGDYVFENCEVENVTISGIYGVGGISGIAHYGNTISEVSVDNVSVISTNNDPENNRTGNIGLIVGAVQGTEAEPSIIEDISIENTTANVTYTDGTTEQIFNIYGTNMNGSTPVTNYVAQIVGGTQYTSVIEALRAAIDTEASELVILKDVREKMTEDFDLVIKSDLTITAAKPVKVEFYNEGTAYDFAVGSTNNNTLTIAENVHFDLTDRVIWLGYYGNNVNVVVNGYLGGYQIWHGADTQVTATGKLDSHGEAFIMRRNATLTVDGGEVNANYFQIYSGHIEAEDATITAGLVWINNNHSYGSEGTVSMSLDNTTFTSRSEVKVYAGEGKQVPITLKNSTTFTAAGALTTGENVIVKADATSDFIVKGNSIFVAKTGDYKYPSLATAIGVAVEDATITVLQNITLAETATIPAGKVVTLDLNGKTISQVKAQTAGYQMILNDGNLTIEDSSAEKSGKISYTDSGNGGEYISDVIYNRATLIINGGTIENLSSATVAANGYPHAVDTYSGIRNASVTINGGTIYCAEYSAVRMFCVSENNTADLTINGGTINGSIDMQNGIVAAAKGSLRINDGNFATTKNANNIRFANWNGGATGYGIVASIEGGIFNGNISTQYVPAQAGFNKKFITGGTFTVNPQDFCHVDYTAIENSDGTWTVKQTSGTQTREFTKGWNWFSSYVNLSTNNPTNSGLEKLETALGTSGIQIKGQTNNQSATYEYLGKDENGNELYGWIGSFTPSVGKMYMVKTSAAVEEAQIYGDFVDYENTAIALNKGWNWISYPLNVEVEINEALKDLEPEEGDVIKMYGSGFAEYYIGQWWPTEGIETLKPGLGYMYKSAKSTSFVYSADEVATTTSRSDDKAIDYRWTPETSEYAFNMSVIATLNVDGEMMSDGYEIAAFANGECRGSARPIYIEKLGQYMLFLTIYGDEVEELTFKCYDVNYGTEYELSNRFNYSSDAVLGSMAEPYMFNMNFLNIEESSLDMINIYPNPTTTDRAINLQATCDNVEVFNALGVKVAEYQNVDTIDALETAGIYVIKVTINGETRNCRLVVK